MSSLSKLIQLWNNDRFVPGGQTVSDSLPSDNESKRERFTKLHHDRTIVQDIRDGIAILGHAVDGLEKTQEFNRDPSAFKGNTREVLMSDDFLMVAHVLRLVFPEGMMSELRPRKRGRDEVDDDDDNNNHEEGGTRKYRPLLTPKGPSQLVSRPKQGPYTGGLFKSTKPEPVTFTLETYEKPGGGLFKSTKPEYTGITFNFPDLKTDEQPGYHTSSTSDSGPALSSGILSQRRSLFSTAEKPLKAASLFYPSSGISPFSTTEKPLQGGSLFCPSSTSSTSDSDPALSSGILSQRRSLFSTEKPLQGGSLFCPSSTSSTSDSDPALSSGILSQRKSLFSTEKPLQGGSLFCPSSTSSTSDSDPALSSGILSNRRSLFSTAEKPLQGGSLFCPSSTSSEKPLFAEKQLKDGPGSLQPSFAGSGFSTSDIGSADKPLSTGGLSSFEPGFSSLGFGSSGISSADTDSLGSKEIYEQTQLLTGPSFSDLRLTNEDKVPGLGEPHGQTFKRGHEEELEVAVKARKGGNQERFKLETPQDLISF